MNQIHAQAAAPLVVVVNDDLIQLTTLSGLLEQASLAVRTFHNAESALAAFAQGLVPQLIITDLHMPGIDGWRFCRLLRCAEFKAINQTPILVVSATFAGEHAQRITTDTGANRFLPVPYEAAQFHQVVRALLAGETVADLTSVLIIEDDAELNDLLRIAFESQNYQVYGALTGAEGRACFQRHNPQIVVIDYHLPDTLGDSLLEEFRQANATVTIILMTGDATPSLGVRFLHLGASAYVRKPFVPEYLITLGQQADRERSMLNVECLLETRTQELRESEARYRRVIQAVTAYTYCVEVGAAEVVKTRYRAAYAAVTGYTAEELGNNAQLWRKIIVEEDAAAVEQHERQISLGQDAGALEHRIYGQDGALRWVRNTPVPRRSAVGILLSYDGLIQDITERVRLEEQLRHSQKMEGIGQLAGGVAHDFNNLLTIILSNISLVLGQSGLTVATQEWLQQALNAGDRAAALVKQLLTFSRKHPLHLQVIELNLVVNNLVRMLQRVIGENIRLECNFAPAGATTLYADASMMEQMLLNLALNARDAMPKGGLLSITTELKLLEPSAVPPHLVAPASSYVCLTVRDTGCGIAPEILPRIFEPFFTTKEIGKGTGLGLATVYGIVQQHRGWIDVDSAPGQGTTFRVYLPMEKQAVPEMSPFSVAAPANGGNERILVVEEELALRQMVGRFLRSQGYQVMEAAQGLEARQLWNEQPDHFDLLLTDLILPGELSGQELARQLRQEKSDLKVVLTSCYSPEIAEETVRAMTKHCLIKPYRLTHLAEEIRRCLDNE